MTTIGPAQGSEPLIVRGAGIAGLAMALFAAGRRPVVVATGRSAAAAPVEAVEAVPAALLGLLLELGIAPADIDVDGLCERRVIAWATVRPERVATRAAAHVDRGRLLAALRERAESHPSIRLASVVPLDPGTPLVDATGRAACWAAGRLRPPAPWVAHWVSTRRGEADPSVHIAACPEGYAYRLGSATTLTVGWAGPGRGPADGMELVARLWAGGAAWLIDDLDPAALAGLPLGRRPAGLSVPLPPPGAPGAALPIGDAALARDSLASQGTSLGLSDARLAAAGTSAETLAARRADAYTRHLTTLRRLLAESRFAAHPAWRHYASWLAGLPAAPFAPVT